jgi:hypothetical protein
MNPLAWTREHQAAGVVFCIIGVIGGLLLAWFQSPFYRTSQGQLSGAWANTTGVFLTWLSYPEFYWPWSLLGAAIAGLGFYAAHLLRSN